MVGCDVGVKGEYTYFLGGCEHPCPRSGWYRPSLKEVERIRIQGLTGDGWAYHR